MPRREDHAESTSGCAVGGQASTLRRLDTKPVLRINSSSPNAVVIVFNSKEARKLVPCVVRKGALRVLTAERCSYDSV